MKNYYEERGKRKRTCEINRIVLGLYRSPAGVPASIPAVSSYCLTGEDINSFTPVQHPANDMTSDIVTTHFDYHSIDHNLLKLDILGHDDPTMIRMLQDLTGIERDERFRWTIQGGHVPVPEYHRRWALTPDEIGGCPVGSLGDPGVWYGFRYRRCFWIPSRRCFSDLIRISGLGHGTDVWLGNAQTLILDGVADISHCICCRDDIMIYLISMGVDSALILYHYGECP